MLVRGRVHIQGTAAQGPREEVTYVGRMKITRRHPGSSDTSQGAVDITIMRRGSRIRLELQPEGSQPTRILLYDTGTGTQWRLYPAERLYAEVSASAWEEEQRSNRKAQLKLSRFGMGAFFPSPLPGPLTPTGRSDVRGQHPCREYAQRVTGATDETEITVWATEELPKAEMEAVLGVIGGEITYFAGLGGELPGFPLEVVRKVQHRTETGLSARSETRTSIQEVSFPDLDEALFAPPTDYRSRPWDPEWEAKRATPKEQ
jgi:hypothetical protein